MGSHRRPTPPTDTSNGPVPVIEDAQLKRLKIAFEDAVEAAIDMPGNVRANVGALLIGRAVKYERSIGKRVYEGDYNVAGEPEGRGTERFASGSVYEGGWDHGQPRARE